jgi:hypothetical protein
MEILTTAIIEEKTLTVGDSWNIGNSNIVYLKELFDIDGEIYMTTTINNQPNNIKINRTQETYQSNRYVISAKKWVSENIHLFN